MQEGNFLWQVSFFVLQNIHIVLLLTIFFIGMNAINVFYIGLLYFIIKYVSSVAQYRKSKWGLVTFTAFFIWVPYLWNVLKGGTGDNANFDENGVIYKLMQMLTNQDTDEIKNEGTEMFNSYMEVPVPFGQWTILFLTVFLKNVNSMYVTKKNNGERSKKPKVQAEQEGYSALPDGARPGVETSSVKDADYYENKISQELTKKFPTSAKIFIRISVILSEMMILFILIV